MRYGKTFRKRFLTFLLSLAMVLTSVNVPMLIVRAEEETPVENDNDGTPALTAEDGDIDPAAPADDGVEGDGAETPAPTDTVATPDDPNTSDDPAGDGSEENVTTPEESGVSEEPEGDETDVPDKSAQPDDSEEDEPAGPKDEDIVTAVNNEFEAPSSGTHGATYDADAGTVTFFVNSDDAGFSAATHMFYKEYDSYASAAKAHVSNSGDFTAGLGATIFTEETPNKVCTKSVTTGTGAILYLFNVSGFPRADYEHIIVIDPDAEPGEPEEPEVPKAPVGLVAKWWDEVNTPNYGKIYIAWAGDNNVEQWEISVDGEVLATEENKGVPPYFAPNVYAAGSYTVSLVAINSAGRSEAATTTFTLTAEQAGLAQPKEKNNIIISEQQAQAKVGGGKITLSYVADNNEFAFNDYSVKINGTEADKSKITIETDSIELDGSLFPNADTYKIQFEQEGYNFSPVYQKVYAADTTDDWTLDWHDEFDGTALDMTKWDYQTGNGSAYGINGWGNEEKQIYTNSTKNTTVGDGKLTITGRKEGDGYTSARLRTVKEEITDGKAAVGTPLKIGTYGKIEAKIKLPAGQGIWPAFWMLPHDSEYGAWAASGEIDIMEARGRLPKEVCGTIHYGTVWPDNSSSGETYHFKDGDSIEQYHLYTYEWDPTEMRWYVDGELYSTINNWHSVQSESGNYPYPAPFDEEFYILLNMALGGNFDSDAKELEVDENGVDMDVDYVRWYQRTGGYSGWDIKEPEVEKDESENAKALLATADANGNFIKDGDFSQMKTEPYKTDNSWDIKSGYWAALLIPEKGNGNATWSKQQVDNKNYLKVAVNSVGSQTYSSQMLQYFPVVKGYSYEISYTAYTDAANQKADISLKIGGDADNSWKTYSSSYTDKLSTTPTTYTHKFKMAHATDPTARFEFNLATSAGTVYLSDVCVKLTDAEVSEDEDEDNDKEPLADGNHVYNGGFSNGSDGLLYWHWGTSDEPEKVKVVKETGAKERKAEIKAGAGDPVSMWQYGINLLQTDEYVLTFDVDSTAAQDIELKVTNQDGTVSYASATKSVTAGASQVKWEFTQPEGKTDTSGKLTLTFNGDAKLDNVKLVRTTFNNVDYDKVDLYPLANGDFSNGLTGWNIWHEGAGWETHKVNDAGQLQLDDVKVDANATFYCIGIKSPSMTLTKGVNYKVAFDYTLPEAKTYTLELCGIQKEITLEGGTHTYESEAFPGNGSDVFALYLGPYPATNYTFILDNVVVSADLPEKEGYYRPVTLAQSGKTKLGSDVVITYAGDTAEREEAWGKADKTYYLAGKEIDAGKVKLDTAKKTITLDSSLFTEEGEFAFYVKAEGYVETKAINLTVLDASDNLLSNGNFSSGKAGWTFYLADWTAGGSFEVNEEGVAVIEHRYDGGEDWHFQLYQDLDYAAGDYIVTFDAWADVERPIGVHIQPDGSSPAFSNTDSHVVLSTEKKNYKLIWKGLDAGSAARFDIVMGSMTYGGIKSPNEGTNPYNIYLDNIVFRPLTADDENASPATIASAGAGKAGTDNVTLTCTDANEKWQNAKKTVYVNGTELSADKVTDSKTSIVIDKSAFTEGGRYSIYVVAEGFEETNKIFKNMIGADGNRIFGGDMNDASQWTVSDEDPENLSKGSIARGIYTLDYKGGHKADWGGWVTWSSQLRKDNISVEAGMKYVLRFEASTDLVGDRDIIIEYSEPGAEYNHKQTTVTVKQGGLSVYEVEITPVASMDDFYINYLLGPVGANLQIDNPAVPHTVKIDNVTLRPASEDAAAVKAELQACIAEYEGLTQGEYTDESWAAFTAALTAAKKTAADADATTTEISAAINNLKRAAEKLTKPTDKTELQSLINAYADVDGDAEFKKAYANAQEILNDPEATQKEIDDAIAALKEAYSKLPNSVDKTALQNLVDEYADVVGDAAFDTAYAKAQEILNKAAATQQEVDDALAALVEAYNNLEGLRIAKIPDQTYTGAAIKPDIRVYNGTTLLEPKKDYTVAYKNNTKAGTATVTVTGKGNFKGKDTATFTITKQDIGDEDVITVADVYAIINSKGRVTNPKVTVKHGKKTLKLGTDYRVEYPKEETLAKDADGNVIAQDCKITITTVEAKKKGSAYVDAENYSGSRTINYTILATGTKEMSKAKVTLVKTKVDYAGENGAGTEKPEIKSVKIGTITLDAETDYTVDYDNWDQIGKATVTVTAKNDTGYYGSKSVTYTVNGTKLAAKNLDITGINPTYDYTGKPIYVSANADDASMNTLKVKTKRADAKELTEGTDYTVSYKTGKKAGEHTNVGTVTVTITGINAYTGSITKTFKIVAVDLTKFDPANEENAKAGRVFKADSTAKYTKTGAKPAITELTFNGEPLVEKKDFTVSCAKNTKVATADDQFATMTIKGKGNFKGKLTHQYKVTIASSDDATATAADIVKPTDFKKLKTTVKVVEKSTGKALKAGTDYKKDIKYYYIDADGKEVQITAEWFAGLPAGQAVTVYAKVDMTGNYAGTGNTPGSLTADFRLYDSSKKITDTKKYEIKVVTNQDKDEKAIGCDSKGNPLYTGAEIKPKVTITPKGTDTTPLTLGEDYTVSYDKNTNKGKATVTVTGVGEYGGTKTLKFTIVSADMKWYEESLEKIATFFSNLF